MEASKGAINESCAFTGLYAWRFVSYAGLSSPTSRLLTPVDLSVIVVAGLRLNTVYVNYNTLDFTCEESDSYYR